MSSDWKRPSPAVTTSGSWLRAGMRRGGSLSGLNELRAPKKGRGKKGPDPDIDSVALPSGLETRPRPRTSPPASS